MTNPSVKLASITTGGKTWAYLEDITTKERYHFQYNPSEIEYNYSQSLNRLTIPGTDTPIVKHLGSQSNIRLPVLMWTQGEDIRPLIDGLKRLTRPVAGTTEAPIVRLVFGGTTEERLTLETLNITIVGSPGGIPDKAKATLTFAPAPEQSEPVVEKIVKTLSPREKAQGIAKIQDRLRKDVAFAKKLKVSQKALLTVDGDGKVTASEPGASSDSATFVGQLKDLLGDM